ncbi:MAG: hypothetical protein QE278_06310 [Limnobacter sp.]|nr:hypothetical protein [Limnobacter sp.]
MCAPSNRLLEIDQLLMENQALCRQLARLQSRASEIIQQRTAEIEQLNHVVEYLSAELRCQTCKVRFLETKIEAFRSLSY